MTKKGQGIGTPALHRRAVKAYQARHKAAGLCAKCPRKAAIGNRGAEKSPYCSRHKREVADRTRARYRRLTGKTTYKRRGEESK